MGNIKNYIDNKIEVLSGRYDKLSRECTNINTRMSSLEDKHQILEKEITFCKQQVFECREEVKQCRKDIGDLSKSVRDNTIEIQNSMQANNSALLSQLLPQLTSINRFLFSNQNNANQVRTHSPPPTPDRLITPGDKSVMNSTNHL